MLIHSLISIPVQHSEVLHELWSQLVRGCGVGGCAEVADIRDLVPLPTVRVKHASAGHVLPN